jgi:ABC-type phosphonate transport system ATPase subunit
MDLLEALNRDRGVALVVVTHDLDIAARAPPSSACATASPTLCRGWSEAAGDRARGRA